MKSLTGVWSPWPLTLAAVAACCLFAAAAAHAEDTCPVLDRAHASIALGATAHLSVEWQSARDYTCTYTAGNSTLLIVIGTYHARQGWPTYTARCIATPEPLTGVGNEAVACSVPSEHRGEIIAHVTDTLLEVTLTQPDASQEARMAAVRQAAERIAGNLF